MAVKPHGLTTAMGPGTTPMPRPGARHGAHANEARPKYRVFENVRHTDAPKPAHSTESGGASPSDQVLERGILIGPWKITVLHGSIANATEVDQLSALLEVPPPEMPFPRNALVLEHEPSGFSYCFDSTRALACVHGVREDVRREGLDCVQEMALVPSSTPRRRRLSQSAIKVAYAHEWGKSRQLKNILEPSPSPSSDSTPSPITTAKQYDWTYSSTWPGFPGSHETPALEQPEARDANAWTGAFELARDAARDRIPVERLGPTSGEPILFYDDVMLYEDELGDNGSSMLNVKVRVMPQEFLVLQRFFLRVDDVVFRVFDTRMYCSFAPVDGEPAEAPNAPTYPRVIRECRGTEAPYAEVKRCLVPHRPNDLSPLTNVNWVAETLERLQMQRMRAAQANIPPAHLPGAAHTGGAQVLGEVHEADNVWEGDGHCIHVAVLRPRP